jgi:GNAT superfamily N-acetyltransferase
MPNAFGRNLVLPKLSSTQLNKKLSVISRVVVHPKYRSIGLGVKLVKETLPLAPTPCVEMIAVMAKYNPFAEKAGMRRIAVNPPSKQALGVANVLSKLGFNIEFCSSEKYVLSKLEKLSEKELAADKEAFIKNPHGRFVKYFNPRNMLFGTKNNYVEGVLNADFKKLAYLIKVCSFLMQSKVYLFWP